MISHAALLKLLFVLAFVESNNKPYAYNPQEKAHGLLQIRQCVIDDVNRIYGTHWKVADAYDRERARRIAYGYLVYWLEQENQSSIESAARIWNGGPEGWWKLSTLLYWEKVQQEMFRQDRAFARELDRRVTIRATPDLTIKWQPSPTNPSPAKASLSIPGISAASWSRSDLAISFHFVWNASEVPEPVSTSSRFTIKPSDKKPVTLPASRFPIFPPAKIL